MTSEEQYNELSKHRKIQSNEILKEKKKNAWLFFRNITNVINLERNIDSEPMLYYAPLRQIRGSNMVCWPVQNGYEIYVDEEFAINHSELVNAQLQHEILHSLTNSVNGKQSFFGYIYGENNKSGMSYVGIDEAVTQMFTEDITGIRLNEETDYLYFIKNIMRVMKVLFGIKSIADQYLANNLSFTDSFNKKTDYKFDPFAMIINEIYHLSMDEKYTFIDDVQKEKLENKKQSILDFTYNLIQNFSMENKNIIDDICNEVQDDLFLEMIGIKEKNISSIRM